MEENKDKQPQQAPSDPSTPPSTPTNAEKKMPAFGALYKEAWELLKLKFWSLIKLFLLVMSAFIVLILVLAAIVLATGISGFSTGNVQINAVTVIGLILGIFIYLAGLIFISAVSQIGYIKIFTTTTKPAIKATIKESIALIWPFFTTLLLSQVLILGGLMVFIAPGIAVAILFSFVGFVVVVENLRGKAALRRSYQLVKSHFWRICFAILIVQVPLVIIDLFVRNYNQDNPHMTFVYFVYLPFSILSGLFIQSLSVVLYKNAKLITPQDQSVNMKWIYVVAIIGLVLFGGLFAAVFVGGLLSGFNDLSLPPAPQK